MPELARHHRVIAPDLRGIGGSTRAAEGYDLHTLSDDMAGLLAALDARHAVAVGIDAGAPIAWMLAMRHAAHVRKLVVMWTRSHDRRTLWEEILPQRCSKKVNRI